MWSSYLFWRASWCNKPSWWNCEGQIPWQLVRHLHPWRNTFPEKKMCDPTNKKPGLERTTKKEKGEKVEKQGYTMTFPNREEVNFALRFETLDLPPYGKSQAATLKTSWKATVQRPVIVSQMSTPYKTRFTQSWVEPWGMYLHCGSYLWEMASQVQQECFGSLNLRCTHRTQQRWRHCTTLSCVYSSTDVQEGLSSSVMTTTMLTRMVSTHEVSAWPSFTISFNTNAI